MRRLSPGYCKRGGFVNSAQVPFKELLPMRLKTQVSSKGERKGASHCIQEMSVFFACMKKSEFDDKRCTNELESFQQCVANFERERLSKKQSTPLPQAGKNLSHHQITTLLKRFPG